MKKLLVYILLATFSCLMQAQTATEKLDQLLEEAFTKAQIPGVAMTIVNKDQILYQNQLGYANVSNKKPYTLNTVHNIGSTSKTFIGVALMQLVEAGKLDLDADINTYLPFKINNPYHPATPITLRQLATHTSSIRDRTFNYDLQAYISDDNKKGNRKGLPLIYKIQFKKMLKNEQVSLGTFLENTLSSKGKWYKKKNFHKNAPATTYHYSNIGAALAAYIIEVVTGEKYADYVTKNILKPLKMKNSGWTTNSPDLAKRYIEDKAVPDYRLITYPDGGLVSSTADLSTYLMAMLQGLNGENDLLSSTSFQEMFQNNIEQMPLSKTASTETERQGIFWDIYGKTGDGDIGHSGSDPGILSFMYFDPKTGLGCVLTTNTDSHKKLTEVVDIWKILIKNREKIAKEKAEPQTRDTIIEPFKIEDRFLSGLDIPPLQLKAHPEREYFQTRIYKGTALSIYMLSSETAVNDIPNFSIDEFVYYLNGKADIEPKDGGSFSFHSNDYLFVPKGFSGKWTNNGGSKYHLELSVISNKRAADSLKSSVNVPFLLDKALLSGIGITEISPGKYRDTLYEGVELAVTTESEEPCEREIVNHSKEQLIHVLNGSVTITPKNGNARTFYKGDFFVLPKGFIGRWKSEGQNLFRSLIVQQV